MPDGGMGGKVQQSQLLFFLMTAGVIQTIYQRTTRGTNAAIRQVRRWMEEQVTGTFNSRRRFCHYRDVASISLSLWPTTRDCGTRRGAISTSTLIATGRHRDGHWGLVA